METESEGGVCDTLHLIFSCFLHRVNHKLKATKKSSDCQQETIKLRLMEEDERKEEE